MRDSRIVFVEGMIGSGKSTTAQFMKDQLGRNRIPARFLPEGPTLDEPRHPLRVATGLPHPRAVWRDVTVEGFVELSLRKWRAFVGDARRSTTVTVCDGLLFHGNMTDLLLMDAEPDVLRLYVDKVIESVFPLNPAVIYFFQSDVARALRTVCNERGSAWEASQVNWKLRSPYAVKRSLQGFEGFVRLYQAYRALCDGIFAEMPLPKLAIDNGGGNWGAYYHDVLTFLQVPPAQRG